MNTIGIFGGSFNPPHYGHVLSAMWALATGEVDQVTVVPCWEHAFGKQLVPYAHRLEMLHLAFDSFDSFYTGKLEISAVERRIKSTYAIEMVRAIQEINPESNFRFLVGMDLQEEIEKWKDISDLKKIAPPLWIPRKTDHLYLDNPNFTMPSVSSTLIRLLLSEQSGERFGSKVKEFLNPKVYGYIRENDLYL